jgi:TonB family protein
MTEVKDNSSLPLLLTITGAVAVVVLGGWFFLSQQTRAPEARDAEMPANASTSIEAVAPEASDAGAVPATRVDQLPDTTREAATNINAELRKARLAADAEIFVLPASQSALYYYGRVLRADPQHAVAAAELDAVLARVSIAVSEQLENREYETAYEIAVLVARQAPEHELVVETQRVLDEYTEQLVDQAIQAAQAGDDSNASGLLAAVENLPGRNPDYIAAVRDSITEIRDVRVAAERDREQRARLADGEAKEAWLQQTRAAIEAGKLITPAGASARDLLAEQNSWAAERELLEGEYLAALLDTARARMGAGELESAESLLDVAAESNSETEGLADIRAALDEAFIEARSTRIVSTKELVNVTTVPPRYPRRAMDRDISGWVIIEFTVTTEGTTGDIEVRQSEPERVFNKAAIEAVEQWVFQPVIYRGRAINQRAAARLSFAIE